MWMINTNRWRQPSHQRYGKVHIIWKFNTRHRCNRNGIDETEFETDLPRWNRNRRSRTEMLEINETESKSIWNRKMNFSKSGNKTYVQAKLKKLWFKSLCANSLSLWSRCSDFSVTTSQPRFSNFPSHPVFTFWILEHHSCKTIPHKQHVIQLHECAHKVFPERLSDVIWLLRKRSWKLVETELKQNLTILSASVVK